MSSAAKPLAGVYRLVGFNLVDLASLEEFDSRLRDLQKLCLLNGKECILGIEGGLVVGETRFRQGYNAAYTLQFRDIASRDYYSNTDPAHKAFGAWLNSDGKKLSGLVALDFVDGILRD